MKETKTDRKKSRDGHASLTSSDLSAVGSVNTSRGRIGHLCSHVPIRTFTVFNIHDDVVSTDYWYEVFESVRCFSKTVSAALPDPTLDTLQTCTQHIKHFYGCSFSSDTSFYGCWIRIKPMLSCFKQIMQRPVFFLSNNWTDSSSPSLPHFSNLTFSFYMLPFHPTCARLHVDSARRFHNVKCMVFLL